ncbi:MAG: RNA polymerase subunit sigma-24 [Chlorobiaceae bacterium]|nr:RNA polymerase subunit sigma-24 [Chlorobiaceae bacterium]
MIEIKKTPMDLINDIYSLAYWMTGSEKASTELVSRTYLNTEINAPETEVIKTFRECYIDTYGQNAELDIHDTSGTSGGLIDSLRQWSADIKLSVLLSELSGLKHAQISGIIGKPVETVRLWLFWGRKFFVNDHLLRISA